MHSDHAYSGMKYAVLDKRYGPPRTLVRASVRSQSTPDCRIAELTKYLARYLVSSTIGNWVYIMVIFYNEDQFLSPPSTSNYDCTITAEGLTIFVQRMPYNIASLHANWVLLLSLLKDKDNGLHAKSSN